MATLYQPAMQGNTVPVINSHNSRIIPHYKKTRYVYYLWQLRDLTRVISDLRESSLLLVQTYTISYYFFARNSTPACRDPVSCHPWHCGLIKSFFCCFLENSKQYLKLGQEIFFFHSSFPFRVSQRQNRPL